jgi:hypothetical protein
MAISIRRSKNETILNIAKEKKTLLIGDLQCQESLRTESLVALFLPPLGAKTSHPGAEA